jgi:hypothetical protein
VSFFEPPAGPPEPPPPSRRPPWSAPPENEIGVSVPLRLVLVRNDELALALVDVVAYSTGFALRLTLRLHPEADHFDPHELMRQLHGGPMGSTEGKLRFGVEFADGRKATNLGPRRPPREGPPPLSLIPQGGGGGGSGSWQTGYWVFPLPPPGPINLAVAWPARGIDETFHVIDPEPIVAAARDSIVLWDDNRPIRDGGPNVQIGSAQEILPP